MARLVVGEYRGYADKNGTMDDGKRWAHRRINLEDEAGESFFVKIPEDRVDSFTRPEKGDVVAYEVDRFDRVVRQLPDAQALSEFIAA